MKTTSTSASKFNTFLHSCQLSVALGLCAFGVAGSNLAAQSAVSGQVALSPTLAVVAGSGSTVPSITAGAATATKLNGPVALAVDVTGNRYIADASNNLVEQVNPAGQLVVIAGGGGTVPTVASEAATSAKLNNPAGVAVDASGNIYIADAANNLVEQVSPAGQIVVIAGGGGTVPSFTSGAATSAQLNNPTGVAVDPSGNIYIADKGNNLVEEVTAGQIVVIAGGGIKTPSSAFSRDASTVKFINPSAVAVDGAQDVYIVDQGRSELEELTAGQVTVVIGGGSMVPSFTAGAATSAQLNSPSGVTLDARGNLYIADQGNGLIEEVSGGQIIAVLAGGGSTVPTTAGGTASDAKLNNPAGTAVDATGNVYIADQGNNLIEELERAQATLPVTAVGSTSPSQTIQIQLQLASVITGITVSKASNGTQEFTAGTITGCAIGGASNPAGTICTVPVTFSPAYPGLRTGVLSVNNGSSVVGTAGLYGTALGPELVESPGALSAIAGGGNTPPGTTAAPPLSVILQNPTGEAIDGAGNLYVVSGSNGSGTVDEISAATGQITVVAGGGGTVPSTTPEPATNAAIQPYGVAVDGAGNIYIGDFGNGLVEKVDATTGQIVVIAGGGGNSPSTTPEPATTAAIYPFGVAVDTTGNVYLVDRAGEYGDGLIEEIAAGTGQIVVVAGQGFSAATATPTPAISAGFYQPTNVAVDGAGNYYIADAGNDRVEKVTVSSGQIVAVAGFGPNLPSPTPTLATDASLNNPFSVAVDAAGNVYIADGSNGYIDQVNPAGQIVRIAGGGTATPASAGAEVATSAQLYNPTGIAIDGAGNLYIADSTNNLVEKVATTALPLAFSNTYVGATNAAQQSVTLENIGNQTLNISSLSSAADFPLTGADPCTTVGSGTSCSLVYGFLPTATGALDEVATLTDNSLNGTNTQQTISFAGTGVAPIVPVNPGSYTLTANPMAVTIKAGQTGSATVTLTPVGGYSGAVMLNCANLPANTTCVFSQSGGGSNGTVTLSGNNQPVQVTLAIQTDVPQQVVASAGKQSPLSPILPALAFWWPGSLVGLAAFGRRKKQRLMQSQHRLLQIGFLILITGAMAGVLTGCGGGSHSTANATPAGTSTVTVMSAALTGSSGLSQSVNLTLTITQ